MASASPNLPLLKAMWTAIQGIGGEKRGRSYADVGMSFHPCGPYKMVFKDGLQVASVPTVSDRKYLRSELLAGIAKEARIVVAQIDAVLRRELNVPDQHDLVIDFDRNLRLIRTDGCNSFPITIERLAKSGDGASIRAELRFFLDAPRACLFIEACSTASGRSVDLLATASNRERHPRAGTYGELASKIATTFNVCLTGRWQVAAASAA